MNTKCLSAIILTSALVGSAGQVRAQHSASNENTSSSNSRSFSPAEAQNLAQQLSIPVADAVRTAEQQTGGKAVCVELMQWQAAQAESSEPLANRKFGDTHPVVQVATVSDNKLKKVIVCGKTGEVLATRECHSYANSAQRTHQGATNSQYAQQPQTGRQSSGVVSSGTQTGRMTDANNQNSPSSSSNDTWTRPASRWQKASDLMGKEVVSASSGQDMGDVRELVIEPDGGRVIYYIVDFENELGHGDKWFAIPASLVRLSNDYKNVLLNINSGQINDANGFDSNNWPNIIDQRWGQQIHDAYGQRPYWQIETTDQRTAELRRPPNRWQKAGDLIGKDVRNPQDENLGSLKEIVVDPDSGRILYGVVSFGGFLGMGDKLFAVPWSALKLSPDYKIAVLNVDKDRLKSAEGFDKDRWPNMADERWAATVYDYYGQPRYWDPGAGK